jgi:hypothetical protein
MSLDPTHVRLKLYHACDQWHSSRVSPALTGRHCELCPNTEGFGLIDCNPKAMTMANNLLAHYPERLDTIMMVVRFLVFWFFIV